MSFLSCICINSFTSRPPTNLIRLVGYHQPCRNCIANAKGTHLLLEVNQASRLGRFRQLWRAHPREGRLWVGGNVQRYFGGLGLVKWTSCAIPVQVTLKSESGPQAQPLGAGAGLGCTGESECTATHQKGKRSPSGGCVMK